MSLDRLRDATKPQNIARRVRERVDKHLRAPGHTEKLRRSFEQAMIEDKVVEAKELYPKSK